MFSDIEAVLVRMICRARYDITERCSDEKCDKCKGAGVYITELQWRDFIYEVREELAPPPNSVG